VAEPRQWVAAADPGVRGDDFRRALGALDPALDALVRPATPVLEGEAAISEYQRRICQVSSPAKVSRVST
jgi:hypothetical protein